jgi:HTH-type transcriptional regulator/antitoxin HigA
LVPLTEIRRRGWIQSDDSLDELERAVCAFLEIATPNERPQVAVSLRQSQIDAPEVAAEIAWVKRVEHLARAQAVGDFDRERLGDARPELLGYAARAKDVAQVPSFLRRLGVHFAIVPHLPKTYLDGAAFTLNDHPVVALTLRYDRIDNFWFTLLHELAHIVAGHEGGYLDNLDEEDESVVEVEANRLARSWLINPEALVKFVADTEPYFSEGEIRAFAESQGCHPGIVLGRLQYENLVSYKNLRKLLVPVKKHLRSWIDVSEPNGKGIPIT